MTAEGDNPSLTIRLSKKELNLNKSDSIEQPVKIILGNLKKSKKVNKIFSKNSKVIIGSNMLAKNDDGIEYIKYKKKNFLEEFMHDLYKKGISSILVEGGQKTLNAFIANNLFDELVLYTAPMFLGKESIPTIGLKAPKSMKHLNRLKMAKIEKFNNDIKTTYYNGKI